MSEGSEGQSRSLVDQRLVRGFVDHEAIDSVQQLLVRGRLQGCRRPRPGRRTRGQRLCRRKILAVDMRHRRRLAIIRVVAELFLVHSRDLRPHRAHRDFGQLLHFHAVGDEGASALVRFPIVPHAPLFQRGLHLSVVLVGDQVGDGLAEIPQELVAGFGALDHSPGENRHPGRGS